MEGFRGRLGGRLGGRFQESAPSPRRQVMNSNGGFLINKSFSDNQTCGSHQHHILPPSSFHLSPSPLLKQPLSSIQKPFTSFADLFKNQHSDRSKGILPLPSTPPISVEEGWTKVIHRKKFPPKVSPQPASSPISKRCFFCGDLGHMARSCRLKTFKCFICNKIGHTSRACPSFTKSTPPAPLPCQHHSVIPIIPTPDSVIDKICKLSLFGIFTLGVGSPSIEELREMLEYKLNVHKWNFQILQAEKQQFLVQFPSEELLSRTVLMGYIDLGSFGGTFSKWSETRGMVVYPKPELYWIKLSGIPLHLWDCDFLASLLSSYGEIYASSKNVMFMEDISACKVLLKTKCKKDIPKVIQFRYVSPINGFLLEGRASIDVLGLPMSVEGLSTREGADFLVNEGDSSRESPWQDLQGLWSAMDIEVQRPFSSDATPPADPPVADLAAMDYKGKRVIGCNSNQAGNKEPEKESNFPTNNQGLQPAIPSNSSVTDMVEIIVEGKSIFLPRAAWEYAYGEYQRGQPVGPSFKVPPSAHHSKQCPSTTSSFRQISDAISSSTQPPGFERPPRPRRRKTTPISLYNKPYHRFMAGSSKHQSTSKRTSPPSPKSSSLLPINSINSDSLVDIASNCGVQASAIDINKLKSIEVERAHPSA